MAEYSYTVVPGKVRDFLGKIRAIGVPPKVTIKWMESIGYKSKNDRSMQAVLQQIRFIDGTGIPSELWTKYRGSEYRKVLGDGILEGYADLFSLYPDANVRSNEELESFFSTRSTAGKQVISKTVSTFKTLCELAEFSPSSSGSRQVESRTGDVAAPATLPSVAEVQHLCPKLHIDIQIHISPETTPEQIDQIFASMAKHLSQIKD